MAGRQKITTYLWFDDNAEQAMNFYVPPSEGHDDHLMSAALCNHAARETRLRIARGR